MKNFEILEDKLINVIQLISGWRSTTPKSEWSDFDEKAWNDIHDIQKAVINRPSRLALYGRLIRIALSNRYVAEFKGRSSVRYIEIVNYLITRMQRKENQ